MNAFIVLALVALATCHLGPRRPANEEPLLANSKEFDDATFTKYKLTPKDQYDFNIFSVSSFTWKQRYFEQTVYYKPELNHEKVMVVEIGAEAAAHPVHEGEETAEIAKKYNAVFFVLEHRFFSDEEDFHPSSNTSGELRYLTTYNALFDLIEFIFDMDEQYRLLEDPQSQPAPEGTLYHKWIILGGSYPGALAGFIAQQFPHVFTATIASSPVVNAMYELPQFDEHTYAASGNICGRAASIAMREMQEIVNANPESNSVYKELGIEGEDANPTDFAYYMADSNVMGIQYASWNTLCDPLIEAWQNGTSLKTAFIKFLKDYHGSGRASGFSTYDRRIIKKSSVKDIPRAAFRNWWYCTCAEWGFFQPMTLISPLRTPEISMQWHRDFCADVFNTDGIVMPGSIGDPTVRTNTFYGALKIHGPRTMFLNYWQDPWKICSLPGPTENAPHVSLAKSFNYGHCADFHKISDKERNFPGDYEMRAMRQRVDKFITDMVADFNRTHV